MICGMLEYFHGFSRFQQGYLSGVLVVLGVTLLGWVVYLVFRPRRCMGIKIDGERGSLFISAAAVSDFIEILAREHKEISVVKTALLHGKNCCYIRLTVVVERHDALLPPLTAFIRERMLDALKKHFGAEDIKEIEIFVKSVKPAPGK